MTKSELIRRINAPAVPRFTDSRREPLEYVICELGKSPRPQELIDLGTLHAVMRRVKPCNPQLRQRIARILRTRVDTLFDGCGYAEQAPVSTMAMRRESQEDGEDDVQ